jgi:uncharacterized protein
MGAKNQHEWPSTLDVQALLMDGWRPVPFHEFVIKIHSRCDLSCDYCYMYEMADQSWRDQPRRMSSEIAKHTATRIGDHARSHGLPDVSVILHGGEPLLAGPELISCLLEEVRRAVGPDTVVDASVQTNGVGLNDSYLELFKQLGVRVGVSVDGTPEGHDRHRHFASGRGSYAAVSDGLHRLRQDRFRSLFNGLLCTIDLRNNPIATYQALAAFEPPRIDFLLPHGTWATPPPGRGPDPRITPYAEWLITVFDWWYRDPVIRIRLFDEIMRLLLGEASSTELIGLSPSRTAVIETDGSLEQTDTLKAAFHGAAATGLHVTQDAFDDALHLPGIVARQIGERALSSQCRGCRLKRICGGGFYAHRYRAGTGFANPSVYCPDLMELIDHVRQIVVDDLQERKKRAAPS